MLKFCTFVVLYIVIFNVILFTIYGNIILNFSVESANALVRNVSFEVPAIKKQIAKCEETQKVYMLLSYIICDRSLKNIGG